MSGKIKVRNYDSFKSCLWEIQIPPTHTLTFQFEDNFDLEFHQRCGYDRVHIFSGTIEGDNQRQGRFCGPKPGSGMGLNPLEAFSRPKWPHVTTSDHE